MYDSGDSYASGGESEGYDSYISEGEVPSSQTQQPKSRSWTIIDAVKLAHIQVALSPSIVSAMKLGPGHMQGLTVVTPGRKRPLIRSRAFSTAQGAMHATCSCTIAGTLRASLVRSKPCTQAAPRHVDQLVKTESPAGALADKGEESIFRAAGVTSRASERTAQPRGLHLHHSAMLLGWHGTVLMRGVVCRPGEEVTCGTCFCEVPIAEATSMECGHCFCNDCWGQHFNIQIREGKSRRLKCMAVRCGAHCDEDKVHLLAPGNVMFHGLLRTRDIRAKARA